MKAIVLTDHFGNGGAERVASLIVNGISAIYDNEVHVCVFEDLNNYNMHRDSVTFHLLADSGRGHLVNAWLKIRNLARVMKESEADVIFSFGPIMAGYVYLAKSLSGRSNIKVIDSERNDPREEPVEDWKKNVRNFCYNRADILVCQTQMAVDLLREQYGIKSRTVIIPNPITPNLPEWNGQDSKDIITAARLTEQKNLPMMIFAFEMLHKEYPDYRLVIYGEGELRNELESLVKSRGLQDCIFLPGFAKNVHEVMQKAYMYVSSSNYEGISNSMLESLGIGLPIVCTDCPVGGASTFIKDGESGILTPVGDTKAFYLAMKRFVEDKELTLEKITNKWIELV